MDTTAFLRAKMLGLAARAKRLARIDPEQIGIRRKDMPYAPSPAHLRAANIRLSRIEQDVMQRLHHLQRHWARASHQQVLVDIAMVERELDRARRAYGLFFEVFAQRGTTFAPALAAHDTIAADCYAAIRQHDQTIFSSPLLKPLSYMEHGFSPATMRRGVTLGRLLGEANPFPLIRIPWDREHPWQAVFLHEVAHNLHADLGIWQENSAAVVRRALECSHSIGLARVYGRWHKEIFADLAALLLGGPAAAWSMSDFLAYPAPRTMTYRPRGVHPTSYLRVLIETEMLRRMGFGRDAAQLESVWKKLYDPARFHRLPALLLSSSGQTIPEIVDEIAFQPRRNLAQRALADILRFSAADEARIRRGGSLLAHGRSDAVELAPRHLVAAAGYALATGAIAPQRLSAIVIGKLNEARGAGGRAAQIRLVA